MDNPLLQKEANTSTLHTGSLYRMFHFLEQKTKSSFWDASGRLYAGPTECQNSWWVMWWAKSAPSDIEKGLMHLKIKDGDQSQRPYSFRRPWN